MSRRISNDTAAAEKPGKPEKTPETKPEKSVDSSQDLRTLSEFSSLLRLPAAEVLRMLQEGFLPVFIGSSGEVLIDINMVDADTIAVKTLRREEDPSCLVEEIVAAQLLGELDTLVAQAIELAMKWIERDNASAEKA